MREGGLYHLFVLNGRVLLLTLVEIFCYYYRKRQAMKEKSSRKEPLLSEPGRVQARQERFGERGFRSDCRSMKSGLF
jgi:hypothetical protein